MTVMAQDQARAAAEGDTYTNWDQRSPETRTPSVSAPAGVETAPAGTRDAVATKASVAPTVPTAAKVTKATKSSKATEAPKAKQAPVAPALPAPAPAQKDSKLPSQPPLDFSQLGRTDLSLLPQVAVPVVVEPAPGTQAAPDASSSAQGEEASVV